MKIVLHPKQHLHSEQLAYPLKGANSDHIYVYAILVEGYIMSITM